MTEFWEILKERILNASSIPIATDETFGFHWHSIEIFLRIEMYAMYEMCIIGAREMD